MKKNYFEVSYFYICNKIEEPIVDYHNASIAALQKEIRLIREREINNQRCIFLNFHLSQVESSINRFRTVKNSVPRPKDPQEMHHGSTLEKANVNAADTRVSKKKSDSLGDTLLLPLSQRYYSGD